jgi:putative ABC transport system substrate-binding protein
MRRREFIAWMGGAAAGCLLGTRAPAAERVRRVAYLTALAEDDPEGARRLAAFRQGLHELGWIVGGNVQIDYRYGAGALDRVRAAAKELVDGNPDLILAHSTPALAALKDLTTTIPIVFALVGDPVGSGFVSNLARPGGNLTGFLNVDHAIGGKYPELIKEIAPGVDRVALVFHPDSPYRPYLQAFQEAAEAFRIHAIASPVRDPAELEQAIAALGAQPGAAMFVVPDFFMAIHRDLIIALAARYRLPAAYPYRYFAAAGGLISYGVESSDVFRRAASYVDRVLKGEKPGELPVQAPTNFELVVNLKTAAVLGLEIPAALLARADEVIE